MINVGYKFTPMTDRLNDRRYGRMDMDVTQMHGKHAGCITGMVKDNAIIVYFHMEEIDFDIEEQIKTHECTCQVGEIKAENDLARRRGCMPDDIDYRNMCTCAPKQINRLKDDKLIFKYDYNAGKLYCGIVGIQTTNSFMRDAKLQFQEVFQMPQLACTEFMFAVDLFYGETVELHPRLMEKIVVEHVIESDTIMDAVYRLADIRRLEEF